MKITTCIPSLLLRRLFCIPQSPYQPQPPTANYRISTTDRIYLEDAISIGTIPTCTALQHVSGEVVCVLLSLIDTFIQSLLKESTSTCRYFCKICICGNHTTYLLAVQECLQMPTISALLIIQIHYPYFLNSYQQICWSRGGREAIKVS